MTKAVNIADQILPSGTTADRPSSPTIGTTRYNTTTGYMEYYNGTAWYSVTATTPTSTVEYLVVAGGGGGYSYIGGGGAGGYRSSISGESTGGGGTLESSLSVTAGTPITVTVGAGGPYAIYAENVNNKGSNSTFGSITSTGGGACSASGTYKNGGSGCGGDQSRVPGTGTSGQGYGGGTGAINGNTWYTSGGGGGAGAVGQSVGGNQYGGNGGAGLNSSVSGSSINYAAGGGGGCWGRFSTGYSGVAGGSSATPSSNIAYGTAVSSAPANRGGGGSGNSSDAGYSGGAGGSGVVFIRYSDTFAAAASTTGSPTITVAGGYRVYKWTGSGSITF